MRDEEVELVWGLHASIFYLGVRRWVYAMPTPRDVESDMTLRIGAFLRGAPDSFKQLADTPQKQEQSTA